MADYEKEFCSTSNVNIQLGETDSEFKVPCPLCLRKFKERKYLNYHLSRFHHRPVNSFAIIRKTCPLCSFTADDKDHRTVKKMMFDHFNESHNMPVKVESFFFNSVLEFKDWKSKIEEETVSKYIKLNRNASKRTTYVCHRSDCKSNEGRKTVSRPADNSCKINGFCPAAMVTNKKDNGQIKVEFVSTHVGHTNDPEHILSIAERRRIARNLARVPCE